MSTPSIIFFLIFISWGVVRPIAIPAGRKITSSSPYSDLVIFGDSYSDDEHRAQEPAKNPYAALGSHSTGILWPNILVKEMSSSGKALNLYDYSYNGAHANSKLTNMGIEIPDSRAEIREYMSDLKSGKINHDGLGRTLYIWWIGINPIDAIWMDACDPDVNGGKGARYFTDPKFLNATRRIELQVEEVRYQVEKVRADVSANATPASYLVITVPNVDVAPLQHQYVQKWAKGDKVMESDLLKLLHALISQYNEGITKAVRGLEIAYGTSRGFIKTYDIVPLWNSILKSPHQYGIKNVTSSCFVEPVVCSDVDDYLFWDYLHLSPRVEAIISHDIHRFILDQNVVLN